MALFRLVAHAGDACGTIYMHGQDEPCMNDFLVYAKDEATARRLVVDWLIGEERFYELDTFANPVHSTCVKIPARQPQGVIEARPHHCEDHS